MEWHNMNNRGCNPR